MYLKGWQYGRMLRTWTETSTDGKMFVQFVALILNRHLHEMRSVRLKGRSEKVSEFLGKQADIFDEFGLEIPKAHNQVQERSQRLRRPSDLY